MEYLPIGILALILIMLTVIEKIGKNKKPLFKAFLSMLMGITALIIVNLTTFLTGVNIPISLFTVGVSAGGGLPGITLLLFLNLL